MSLIVVKAAFDSEARVWFVETSDLPGLNAEATSVEELLRKVELAAADLLLDGDGQGGDRDVPIELVAHASARARVRAAAREAKVSSSASSSRRRAAGSSGMAVAITTSGEAPLVATPFTVPVNIDSRHTANKVLRDAGLEKAF